MKKSTLELNQGNPFIYDYRLCNYIEEKNLEIYSTPSNPTQIIPVQISIKAIPMSKVSEKYII